jgi:hypothetical protein
VDLGEDHGQYFPGIGVANTEWDDVQLGVADSYAEAVEDAYDQLLTRCVTLNSPRNDRAAMQVEVDMILEDKQNWVNVHWKHVPDDDHDCEMAHYAAIFVKDVE